MLKKVYAKDNKVDIQFEDITTLEEIMTLVVPGTKMKILGIEGFLECIMRDDRYIIVCQQEERDENYDNACLYSILDTTMMLCNEDNLVMTPYFYANEKDCKKVLARLNNKDDTFDLSVRNIAKIKDVIEEIWCDCNISNREQGR